MDNLLNIIAQYISLGEEQITAIHHFFKVQHFKKGEYLIDDSKQCDKLYFLSAGYVRVFYYDDGKEITSWIYSPGEFFSSWSSLYGNIPSYEYMEAITDIEVYYLEKSEMEAFYNTPLMDKFGRKLLQKEMATIDAFSRQMAFLTAKQKYQLWLEKSPELFQVAQLSYIASILGMSQETLSRVRAAK